MRKIFIQCLLAAAFIAAIIAGKQYGFKPALNVALFYAWVIIIACLLIIICPIDKIDMSDSIKFRNSHKKFYAIIFTAEVLTVVYYGMFWTGSFMALASYFGASKYCEIEKLDKEAKENQE